MLKLRQKVLNNFVSFTHEP
jgi:hypothetical protein